MNTNTILNKVRTLLGMEVVLEQMKLADGVTVFEADSFEPENAVVIVTEDEQKIPVPVGEYELEDGRILVVIEEGVISEIKEAPEAEVEVEAPEAEMPVEAEAEKTNPKKTVESIIKETFFSEIESLKKENEELKAQLLSKEVALSEKEEVTETELSEVKPIVHNPENEVAKEVMKFASKRPRSIMDSVLDKINK